jgi:Uma2 family endonuclease
MYDLPSEYPEEPGLPDIFHDLQPQLLSRTLRLTDYASDRYFTASDLNVYYDVNHPIWHKRPDWFLAVNVPRLYDEQDLRLSYVVWQEGQNPYVVVEFLSPGTAKEDLGRFSRNLVGEPPEILPDDSSDVDISEPERDPENGSPATASAGETDSSGEAGSPADRPPGKLTVYESYLRVPHYLVYSRYTRTLRYFRLEGGRYQEQSLNAENPLVWLTDLNIGLGLWEGTFEGITTCWLRWCDREGHWFLTDTEAAEQQLHQERMAREQAEEQILQAARNLLATGMELDQVVQMLQLSEVQVQRLQAF